MVKFRTHLRNISGHCWRIICLANIFKHFRKVRMMMGVCTTTRRTYYVNGRSIDLIIQNPSSTEDERLIDAPNADVIGNNPSGMCYNPKPEK